MSAAVRSDPLVKLGQLVIDDTTSKSSIRNEVQAVPLAHIHYGLSLNTGPLLEAVEPSIGCLQTERRLHKLEACVNVRSSNILRKCDQLFELDNREVADVPLRKQALHNGILCHETARMNAISGYHTVSAQLLQEAERVTDTLQQFFRILIQFHAHFKRIREVNAIDCLDSELAASHID